MVWPAMSAPDPGGPSPETSLDEFGQIAAFFRPLTRGEPGALDLLDDAALLPVQPGEEIVVTQDCVVEGVHFPPELSPDDVAARFLRVNLSDLAAKGAEPFAWLQSIAWSTTWPVARRRAFAESLAREAEIFNLSLLGGDTVATPGPLTISGTFFGRCPEGAMVRRSGAQPGDLLLVSGPIGDGFLGLRALIGEVQDTSGELRRKFQRPRPRLDLREVLRACAAAAADISDGLIADARHIAKASGCGVRLDLERIPLSSPGRVWLEQQADIGDALMKLASGGDDYELAIAASPKDGARLEAAGCTVAGEFIDGVPEVRLNGALMPAGQGGWRHP
ncbi:MAG: thiamine-phosphate kinase [Phenylobacterium sp.]